MDPQSERYIALFDSTFLKRKLQAGLEKYTTESTGRHITEAELASIARFEIKKGRRQAHLRNRKPADYQGRFKGQY